MRRSHCNPFLLALLVISLICLVGCTGSSKNEPADPGSSQSSQRPRQNLELTLLTLLAGLILRNTMDIAFKQEAQNAVDAHPKNDPANYNVGSALISIMWRKELPEFAIFLITLLRFVYGAYRFHEVLRSHPPLWIFIIDAVGMIGVFIIVNLAGMCVRNALLFYGLFLLFHAWDFFWFTLLYILSPLPDDLARVAFSFIVFDLATMVFLGLVLRYLRASAALQYAAFFLLLGIGLLDGWWNYSFYVSDNWSVARNETLQKPADLPKSKSIEAYKEVTILGATSVGLLATSDTQSAFQTALILKLASDRKGTIYFAGPLFSQGEWQWNARIAKQLRKAGYEVILPQERAMAMLKKEEPFDAKRLFSINIDGIEQADVVVAILDGPGEDSGTAWECGYAHKKARPVIGVRTDLRRGGDDPRLPLNIMLSQSCREVISLPLNLRDDEMWISRKIVEAVQRAGH
jgi:nucleoside 2-deoxyribosyltransferase